MKKTLAMLLALCMMLSLFAACGKTESVVESTPAEPSAVESVPAEAPAPEAPPAEEAPVEEASVVEEPPVEETPTAPEQFEIAMPLTEEPVTLSYFMRFNPQVLDWCSDFSDNLFYAELEEKSNVSVDFQLLHPMNFYEQFNLQIASGDYADIYCEAGSMYAGGYDQAIEDEVFLDLSEYMEEYAPNYNAIINFSEQNRQDAVTDQGRIAFFAQVYDPHAPCEKGPMIRADWAEEFGMDPAEINTYDEYEAYIEQAYNTYGATVQLPMAGVPGFGYLNAGFETSAGFGNSFEATLPWHQVDGKLYSGVLTEGFIEYTTMVAEWYEKGWIYQDFMSEDFGMQGGADIGMVTSGESSLWWSEMHYMQQYVSGATQEGYKLAAIQDAVKNEGDVTHLGQTNYQSLSTASACVITTACEVPEIAVQWMDYRYSEEGALLANWGVEGVSFEYDAEGNPQYTDLLVNNPEGMTATLAQFRYMLQNTVCLTSVAAKHQGLNEQQLGAPEIWMTNKDNAWGVPTSLTMTTEESEEYNSMAGDIITFAQENFLRYITGEKPISELGDFISTCEEMGLARCAEIQQAALDRYNQR